jgi:probable phosphomutase (TIGR03848 family)
MPRADRSSTSRTERRPGGRRRAPTATTILLVRHGTTPTTGKELPGRAPGLHLSDDGRRQADDVAARILSLARPPAPDGASANGQGSARKGLPVAAVYASPLERTRETAAPIAAALGLDVRVDEGLVELDIGDWTGMELKAAMKRPEWATVQRYPSGFTFPGGESFQAMQTRVLAALDRMRAAHPGEAVVAVSHADPIRAVVAHAMGSHLDMFQRVVVSPCSLTAIVFGAAGPTVLTVNATGPATALVPA